MRGWRKLLKVTDIAVESTGVYWRPIWNVLEEQGFERLPPANPVQVKALAGRKSDGRDCQRIAEYMRDRRLDASREDEIDRMLRGGIFIDPHSITKILNIVIECGVK
jgi:transposase